MDKDSFCFDREIMCYSMNCRKITDKNGKNLPKRSGGEQGDWLTVKQTGGDPVGAGGWGQRGSESENWQEQR